MAAAAQESRLVHVAFNAKATHFVAATSTGIRVFACTPSLKHAFTSDMEHAQVTSADVSLSGTLVAVVLRADPDDRIRYWSELKGEVMCADATPSCRGAVRGVRHAGNHVLVAGHERAALHEAAGRALEFETGPNPLGVCAIAAQQGQQAFVVACPAPEKKGVVQVRRAKGRRRRVDVEAHNSSVACVALSPGWRLVATAGSKGTLLRVFSTTDGSKLQEVHFCFSSSCVKLDSITES